VYLDTPCQSLRPLVVIEAIRQYYTSSSACRGRSMRRLAEEVSRSMGRFKPYRVYAIALKENRYQRSEPDKYNAQITAARCKMVL
jgi:hypothetical protein